MGVSGSGKSTVGSLLASQLGWPFIEADRFHPPENIRKMASGTPLNDADRLPWLRALRAEIDRRLEAGENAVLACSALKRSYRESLGVGSGAPIRVLHLRGDERTIHARMERREHYMKPAMLASQLADLEEPAPCEAVVLDVTHAPEELVARARAELGV